jgi:BirA family transcriptional regulator, biotin operon repressor / biotin---[acetyl-CoA-carboxylase] ligase
MTGAAAPILPRFFRLVALDTVESTNDVARALAAEGAPEGTVVWARTQSSGRGRRGRGWHSPPGNLFMSVVLRPPVPLAQAAQLSFAAAMAVHDAVEGGVPAGAAVELKWPNDVLLDGRKVAGILLETGDPGPGGSSTLIVGIGVNIVAAPPDAAYPATCLADHGVDESSAGVLAAVCTALERWYVRWQATGFGPLRDAWLTRARGLGAGVTVRLPDTTFDGIFVDLDRDGALIVQAGEMRRRISAGDVFFRTGG